MRKIDGDNLTVTVYVNDKPQREERVDELFLEVEEGDFR